MSASSMTGFGRGETAGSKWNVVVEIKTVNNRFKDYRFKMGSALSSQEYEMRGLLDKNFKRGTFDVAVTYQRRADAPTEVNLDAKKVQAWLATVMPLIDGKMPVSVSPTDFLRTDFMRDEDADKTSELTPLVSQAFFKAMDALKVSRNNEGGSLVEKLLEHLAA